MAKARKQKLKVFRTPIGFHDAYVAAPSQKAALEAWGSESNLFAQGAAEQVTDVELIKEPLAQPGVVIRRLRGSAEEQVAALGKAGARKAGKTAAGPRPATSKPIVPRPSRAALDKAEAALEEVEQRHRFKLRELAAEEERLARRRRDLERAYERECAKLKSAIEDERERYERAMARWKK